MPRKKKTETEITPTDVEVVEGRVEGLSYNQAELAIQEESRKKWTVDVNWDGFGKTQLGEAVGMVYLNRTRNRGAKEKTFSCGADLAGAIDAYWILLLDLAEHGHTVIPDVESLADFLGVTRSTLNRWRRGEDNLEFVDPVNMAYNEIAQVQKNLASQGKLNPIMTMANLNNDHGYIQNQKSNEVQLNVRLRNDLPNREQLMQIVERLP